MNIYEKLLTVQGKLKAPKSQYNGFGKYNYRNCEDILEAVKPLLKDVKAVVILSDEIIAVGEASTKIDNQQGTTIISQRYYIKASAKFIDCEKPESEIVVNAYAREEETKKGMDGSQVTGASSSYARKYALNGLFDIDDTKDSDTTNNAEKGKAEPKEVKEETLKEKRGKEIRDFINMYDGNAKEVGAKILSYGVKDASELNDMQYAELLMAIRNKTL